MTAPPGGAGRTLADLPVGGHGRIRSIDAPAALRQRLLEMGLVEGTPVEVVRFAPLGDPMEIRVRGYHLSLRRADARGVTVSEDDA